MDDNGETTLNVSSTSDQITLQPGEFKIYGNQASTTLSNTITEDLQLILYPNPTTDYISINKDVELVEIYDLTGKKLLVFENVNKDQELDVNKLAIGYYVVKLYNENYLESQNLIKK